MSRRRPPLYSGLLPVAKVAGPTSHDVVDLARRALGERRIGHTGTLDPMAEGLLLLCIGRATRLQQHLLEFQKVYRGVIRLGRATDTYDAEGETLGEILPVPEIGAEDLRLLKRRFTGTFDQAPPPYSAKKVAGRKLYELARSGEEIEIEPHPVTVHEIEFELQDPEHIVATIRAASGFYVRSLAHDIGGVLGCGAHLRRLERLSIGPFEAAAALPQSTLGSASRPEEVLEHPAWISMDRIQLPYQEVDLNPGAAERFLHGQEVVVTRSGGDTVNVDDRITVRHRGDLLGIGFVQHVLARGRTLTIRPGVVVAVSS